ncbi:hypothetical protein WA026_000598 [Henosepilachna vigintioctopunctata]|uniref:Acyltransferase 3 domain-containing protein n=1 Tax=Henosepilachna vigintioctopunctata TaxID=420089 RepID=A0AAW1V8U1_9CUCU
MSTTGVLRGSSFQMGNFDQCLTARAPFETKFCLATVTLNIPEPEEPRADILSLYFAPDENVLKRLYKYPDETQLSRNIIKMGWCVPASCMISDLEETLHNHFSHEVTMLSQFNVTYTVKIDEKMCRAQSESTHYDSLDISFYIFCLIIATLVFIGNVDVINGIKNGVGERAKWQKLISAFSVSKNLSDLTRKDYKNSNLQLLHGVRTLLMFVIIICHRSITYASSAISNFDEIEKEYRFSLGCSIYYGVFSVDIFFMISGLLVTYLLLIQFEKERVNPLSLIILRYIRLTPVYAFVIFYYATHFRHTGNGPLWKIFVEEEYQDCRTNWWTNLLYINNYINTDHMCMIQSWYLPCDFHYFIITLGILFIMKKQKKIGLFILLMVFISSMAIPFLLTILYRRHSVLYFHPDMLITPKKHPDFGPIYVKSHTRATPYFIGVICGYLYFRYKDKKFSISTVKSVIVFAVSIFLVLGTMIIGNIYYDPHHSYNAIESGAHAALHRFAWTVGFVGILFITKFGDAKFLKKILTWDCWTPFSKLTFSAYLIHFQYQIRDAASFSNPRRVGFFEVVSIHS